MDAAGHNRRKPLAFNAEFVAFAVIDLGSTPSAIEIDSLQLTACTAAVRCDLPCEAARGD